MQLNPKRPLNEVEKKKAQILLNAAPSGWFAQHGIDPQITTVGELLDAIQVFHCYLHDLNPIDAEVIYSRIAKG